MLGHSLGDGLINRGPNASTTSTPRVSRSHEVNPQPVTCDTFGACRFMDLSVKHVASRFEYPRMVCSSFTVPVSIIVEVGLGAERLCPFDVPWGTMLFGSVRQGDRTSCSSLPRSPSFIKGCFIPAPTSSNPTFNYDGVWLASSVVPSLCQPADCAISLTLFRTL